MVKVLRGLGGGGGSPDAYRGTDTRKSPTLTYLWECLFLSDFSLLTPSLRAKGEVVNPIISLKKMDAFFLFILSLQANF